MVFGYRYFFPFFLALEPPQRPRWLRFALFIFGGGVSQLTRILSCIYYMCTPGLEWILFSFFFGYVLLLLRSKFGALRMDRQYLRKPGIHRKILAISNNIIYCILFFVKYEEKKTA